MMLPSRCARSWRDHDHRSGQKLVGLNDDAVSSAVLFMADSFGESEAVDVTPEHEPLP